MRNLVNGKIKCSSKDEVRLSEFPTYERICGHDVHRSNLSSPGQKQFEIWLPLGKLLNPQQRSFL